LSTDLKEVRGSLGHLWGRELRTEEAARAKTPALGLEGSEYNLKARDEQSEGLICLFLSKTGSYWK
jgi:hypothetical protein